MHNPSRSVCSNQEDLHPDLMTLLQRHRQHPFRKPISSHTHDAFARFFFEHKGDRRSFILDSGCGVGWSTRNLAALYPDHLVLGIDKSAVRLDKAVKNTQPAETNVLFIRADLVDFWRLLHLHGVSISRHYLLYPNPWPKRKDVMKRFHAHPVFFELLQISIHLELRSNWGLYAREFAWAVNFATGRQFQVETFRPQEPISPFEKKYCRSGQALYRLAIDLT